MTSRAIPAPKEQVLPVTENLFKSLLLVGLLLLSVYATDRLFETLSTTEAMPPAVAATVKWLLVVVLGIVDVVLLTGMGALAHDAVHRVLCGSPFWNDVWGGLLSAMTLIPFYANRQFHLTHHGYAHQPGLDPENLFHHFRFPVAFVFGGIFALALQYRVVFVNLVYVPDRRARAVKDIALMSASALFFFGLLPALDISLLLTVVPMLLLFPFVFSFRALSDHYGVPPVIRNTKKREDIVDADEHTWHADRERRQQEVSGWVVLTAPWLEWLWSHVNYHEVHHKYPYLSHRYLPQVFAHTRARCPYLVAHGYWRSLRNLRTLPYYSTPDQVQPFLSNVAETAKHVA